MRPLLPALCATLFLFLTLPSPDGLRLAPQAQAAALTPEELYRKCRVSTFRRHGQRVIRDGRRKLAIASIAATQMVDQCVLRNRWQTVRAP